MYNKFLPKFKVVEINNMAALRMGHVIAQNAIDKNNIHLTPKGEYNYLENGLIVGLSMVEVGERKEVRIANYDAAVHAQPMLVFTEELIAGPFYSLDQFAEEVELEGDDVYPRCLPLYLGDTFTTNNIKGDMAEGYYTVEGGQIKFLSATATNGMFFGKLASLPNGEQAVELQYVNTKEVVVEEDGE